MGLSVSLSRKVYLSYDEGKTYIEQKEYVYDSNITHNLGNMAEKAGIYEALWRPYQLLDEYKKFADYKEEMEFEEKQEIKASFIIPYLEKGLSELKSRPDYFKKFDSPNGWGLYKNFVPFVERYLDACKSFPESLISADR